MVSKANTHQDRDRGETDSETENNPVVVGGQQCSRELGESVV